MAESKPLFVEFHVLASHVPSNLNRDDLGTPKTAMFGGERRLRISSQCLKRTWRTSQYFRGELAETELGVRTLRLPDLVFERLGPDYDDRARKGLEELFKAIGKKGGSGAGKGGEDDDGEENEEASSGSTDGDDVATSGVIKTAHLLFLSRQEIDEIVAFARTKATELSRVVKESKKKVTVDSDALKKVRADLQKHLAETCSRNAVDVGLFGRFVTSDEIATVDAALQVAHAIGTQKIDLEYDYFTAVDDLSNETGAGHLGETEFAASVFYKYAVCNVPQLVGNLAGDVTLAARGLKALAQAMARAVPIGKKNSTAPHNPADYVEVIVRRDAPVSLANAFLRPVRPQGDKDVMDVSIERLRQQARKYDAAYGDEHIVERFVLNLRGEEGNVATLNELAKKLEAKLAEIGGA